MPDVILEAVGAGQIASVCQYKTDYLAAEMLPVRSGVPSHDGTDELDHPGVLAFWGKPGKVASMQQVSFLVFCEERKILVLAARDQLVGDRGGNDVHAHGKAVIEKGIPVADLDSVKVATGPHFLFTICLTPPESGFI